MAQQLKIMIGQLNPTIGAIKNNACKAVDFYHEAVNAGADYAVLSELFLTGYGAKDLFFRDQFLADVETALFEIVKACDTKMVLGIGAPIKRDGKIYNGYIYIAEGKVIQEVRKTHLPNYDVFDEKRHFSHGEAVEPIGPINTAICEDIWQESYGESLLEKGVEILISANASPYYRGKLADRHENARIRAKQLAVPVVYAHYVGVEDEMMLDGGSFVVHPDGELVCQLPQFDEAHGLITFEKKAEGWRVIDAPIEKTTDEWEADYRVMVESLRDYAAKTGFSTAILGLSGGIDSALVAAIAADALGPQNVRVLMMPSVYTSQSSLDDAADCARLLGIEIDSVSISPAVDAASAELEPIFGADPDGLVAENIQPRLRALYLMALSNKFGSLLLTTGNKSEVAVGYATLYGDMAGGYNPIKDLYKMRVFETCRWRNANHRDWMLGREGFVIPTTIIDKPPSAELRPDQKDSDSLPPYEALDTILEAMVDQDQSVNEIVAMGYDRDMVLKVQKLVYIAEYKRFQSAPGVKLTKRHFGTDRRYPIINHWRDG